MDNSKSSELTVASESNDAQTQALPAASSITPTQSSEGFAEPLDYNVPDPPSGKRSVLLSLVGLLVLLLLGGGVWYWWQSRQSGMMASDAMGMSQGIPVRVGIAQSSPVQDTSDFVGTLEAVQSVTLRAEVDGRIAEIFVQAGDRVAAGTPIARIAADQRQAELGQAIASVQAAQAAQYTQQSELEALRADREAQLAEVELQRRDYDRIASLVEDGVLERQRLDIVTRDLEKAEADLEAIERRMEAANARILEAAELMRQNEASVAVEEARLGDTAILAPFAGTVGDISVDMGDYVSMSDPVTHLIDNQILELRLYVPLERLPDLRMGLPVQVRAPEGEVMGVGRISFIAPQVDADSQTLLVKATFNNSNGMLRDQQFVRADIVWTERTSLVVPTSAIVFQGEERLIYIVQNSSEAEMPATVTLQPIELGLIRDDQAEVVSGLSPGTAIVISGAQKLFDGAPIMPLE